MEIDHRMPEANAFALTGLARRLLLEAGRKDEIDNVMADMMSSDYKHLCKVLYEATNGSVAVIDYANDAIVGIDT